MRTSLRLNLNSTGCCGEKFTHFLDCVVFLCDFLFIHFKSIFSLLITNVKIEKHLKIEEKFLCLPEVSCARSRKADQMHYNGE